MTTEKFVRRNQVIAQHLSEAAFHSGQAELGGVYQPANSYFREVVNAQERLLNALERLLEKLPRQTAE